MNQKGFTVLELTIAIAIMVILTAIVIAGVSSYVSKSKDLSIKTNLAMAEASASYYFEANPTGSALCDDATFLRSYSSANALGQGSCVAKAPIVAGSYWCACVKLTGTNNFYCIDSLKAHKTNSTGCTQCSDYACD